MKRFWILCAAAVLALTPAGLFGCGNFPPGLLSRSVGKNGPSGGQYRDGVYEGTGQGWRGPILVGLRLEAGEIAEIEILDHQDDVFTGGSAMSELAELVLEYNTVDLDGISGATESCAGFLAAVEDALRQARRDI
jgi:uncharacterized protein with FMN-binding domain